MRISDWSSDVCSSDLPRLDSCDLRITFACHQREHLNNEIRKLGRKEDSKEGNQYPLSGNRFNPPSPCVPLSCESHHLIEQNILRDLTLEVINQNGRSEEHTSELQSLMRISYAVFGLKTHK